MLIYVIITVEALFKNCPEIKVVEVVVSYIALKNERNKFKIA